MIDKAEWATIGRIVAPFGIRGELKVHPLTDIPDRFTALDTVFLSSNHSPQTIEGVRPYRAGDMLLLKLKGIDDATAAEKLRNCELLIPLSDLAKLPPGSYYQHDIVGLRVLRLNDNEIGTITDIMPTGGNDVYIVTSSTGRQILIPAIKQVIKQVDLIRQVMYIEPIQGLLDDEAVIDDQTEEEVE